MRAKFLQSIKVKDGRKRMTITEGELLSAVDVGDYYELRKPDGRGTLAPKNEENVIYEILTD
jgi:hypothetical protein